MNITKKAVYTVGCIGCSVLATQAETTDYIIRTNSFNIYNSFAQKIEMSGTTATLDIFGNQTSIQWMKIRQGFGYRTLDYVNNSGETVMRKTVVNGIRETVAHLPVTEYWNEWIEDIYIGSMGNTVEERISANSATPTASEESWWKKMKSGGNVAYGVRLDGPSAYATARFGHWLDNPAFMLHGRIYYRPLDKVKLDINIVVPMQICEVSGGVSLDLSGLNQRSFVTSIRVSHGLFHPCKPNARRISDSLSCYAGVSYEEKSSNATFQTGLSFGLPWGK